MKEELLCWILGLYDEIASIRCDNKRYVGLYKSIISQKLLIIQMRGKDLFGPFYLKE